MVANSSVQLTFAIEDFDLDAEELEVLTQRFQKQVEDIAEQVERIPTADQLDQTGRYLLKGDKKEPGLLNIEINLESIKALATWLYERLTGKSTEVKLKFGEGSNALEFEFKGNNQKDLATTMQDVSVFVEKIKSFRTTK